METITIYKTVSHILRDGYRLRKVRILSDGTTSWRCVKRNCSGRLRVNEKDNVVSFSVHNHEPESDRNEINKTVPEIQYKEPRQTSASMSLEVIPKRDRVEHAKKMILIEPIQLDSFNEKKIVSNLDGEILYRTSADDVTDELCSNSISRYLDMPKPSLPKEPSTSVTVKESVKEWDNIECMVIDTVPKTWKSRATRLMKHLQSITDVSWNERGELILKQRLIPKTHLVDLVNDLMRKRANITPPVGWKQLASVLRKSKVPQELIGNKDRLKYINVVPQRNVTASHPKSQLVWSKY